LIKKYTKNYEWLLNHDLKAKIIFNHLGYLKTEEIINKAEQSQAKTDQVAKKIVNIFLI